MTYTAAVLTISDKGARGERRTRRPHVIDALQHLVGRLKSECVTEVEKSAV